ncbi:hypothetical protein C9374_011308 [Naegleria lovaniensis]|uniref:Uncharacterized protein n=1 Tax=Naegleria lovaniensis TaxID=51637 RepID=A0AA88GX08_NAELO|nr:uncharacterized protein C9374_011308 [Naegleria lovaniensis]KAG2392583.1 hypothetical protein C9374_011308 [Naegleria lovaniensis]
MKQSTLSFGSGKKLTINKSGSSKTTSSTTTKCSSFSNSSLTPSFEHDEILATSSPSKINKQKKMLSSTPRRNHKSAKRLEQLYMDCGQKSFTSIRCSSCGMVYMNGDFQDEKVHNQFCKSFKKLMKYKVSAKDTVKEECHPYKIIAIHSKSPKNQQKKAENIIEFIDQSSLQCTLPFSIQTHTMFLYVNSDNDEIVACVVVERIERAHPAFIEKKDTIENLLMKDAKVNVTESEKASIEDIILSTASIDSAYDDKLSFFSWDDKICKRAVCGVNRIWVKEEHRRNGIASKLLDAVREHYVYGIHLEKSDIAFSPPTPKGAYFARVYCERSVNEADFLVYVTSPVNHQDVTDIE